MGISRRQWRPDRRAQRPTDPGRVADLRSRHRDGRCRASSPRFTSGQRTGTGRLVECPLLETAIGFSSWTSAQWLADHEEPTRQGSRHRQNAPYQRMQTKDGYLMVGPPARRSGRAVPRCWGHPEWGGQPMHPPD